MSEKAPITRQQQRAQAAFKCISPRTKKANVQETVSQKDNDEYGQLAKKFPALVHNCGLAQALAFVQAKETDQNVGKAYLSHLSEVMGLKQDQDLGSLSRSADLREYQRLTREAIESATWLKRYSEALLEND
jgi:CRISPR-associated protein Cmr5